MLQVIHLYKVKVKIQQNNIPKQQTNYTLSFFPSFSPLSKSIPQNLSLLYIHITYNITPQFPHNKLEGHNNIYSFFKVLTHILVHNNIKFSTMSIASRTLEITVISGENIHVTEDAYVVVRGESLNCYTTKTMKDNDDCGKNSSFLSWNEKFLLNMPLHARSITFEVQCKKFKSVRPIGVARIAVSDILNGAELENCSRILSYKLRDWEGRQNGVIHFGVRVVMPEKRSVTVAEKETMADGKSYGDRLTGIDVGTKNSNGVVIGIPVWWNYPSVI